MNSSYSTYQVTEEEATAFFLNDPKLAYLSLPDYDIVDLYKHGKYIFAPLSHYIGIKYCGELVAIVRYEYFTEHTINHHIYLSSKYHKTEVPRKIANFLKEFGINELKINKIIIMVPSPCNHVKSYALKHGFKKEGEITNSLSWRQKIVNIEIYGIELEDNT